MLLAGQLAVGGLVRPGWLRIVGTTIDEVGEGAPPAPEDEHTDGLIAPGLVDVQVNGGGGVDVQDGDRALDRLDLLALDHGITSYLPTLASPDLERAEEVAAAIARRAVDPDSPVAGLHLEGPFLAPAHAGMHPLERLRPPPSELPSWLRWPPVRLVTLAPELPGALALIAELRRRDVVVSLGHSGASLEQGAEAVAAGATMVTHLFNAMGPLRHRAPGLPGLALVDPCITIGLIADGHHVAPAVLELVRRAAGERVALVSDASAAAGLSEPPRASAADAGEARPPGGPTTLSGVEVYLRADGTVRTATGELAGSTLTLNVAVRRWTELTEASLPDALRAGSEVPAGAVGLASGIRAGLPADLVVLGQRAEVQRVMLRGRWRF
ncbi:MAG: N-acetylglucosamine-6-phosphate deacetylase [Actinobacteria bacterium]|nr:MAG: N-acetylglucosamine-6-phosphate deacetylase [Actinomycetota bacterium]